MIKWIIGALIILFLFKRASVPDAATTAAGAPPEGNIDSWGNLGFLIGSPSTPDKTPTQVNNATATPVPPVRIVPAVVNFRTRGFYNDTATRYSIPGQL